MTGIVEQLLAGSRFHPKQDPPEKFGALGGYQTDAGVTITPQAAIAITAVYACIRILAETLAMLPLQTYQKQSGGRRPAREFYLDRILSEEPNPEMTSFEFRETLMGHLGSWGNAFAEIDWDGAGRVKGLWPLPPNRVQLRREKGELIYTVRLPKPDSQGRTKHDLPAYRVWHLRGLGSNGLVGYSPIALFRESLGLAKAVEKFGAKFFDNGAQPGVALKHPGVLDDDVHKRIKESWEESHQGLDNSHRVAILEEGMTIEKIGIPPEDAQFLGTRKFQIAEVGRIYRMQPHKIGDLEKATFCLPGETRVFTLLGPKRIKDIEAGERVWSYDGAGIVPAVVQAAGPSGRDEILKIEARGAVLRCNAKHRVRIRREVLKPFNGGRGGVVKQGGRRMRRSWEEMYVPAGGIQPGDYLVAPTELPDLKRTDGPTRARLSIEFCETIGHHLGDGFISGSRGYDTTVGFSHGVDDETRTHYARNLERAFPGRVDFHNRPGVLDAPVMARRRDPNTTVIYNSAAAREMIECGLSGTALEKRVPPWVYGLTLELRLAVLRGYLDSDGTVDKKGRAVFASANRDLIEDFRQLAVSCGLRTSRITSTETHNSFGGARRILYRFGISIADDVLIIGSHRSDYMARAEAAKYKRRRRTVPVYPYESARRGLGKTSVRYLAVTNVVRDGVEEVYDLSVEGTHSFVADGVIVHNSNIEHQAIEFVVDTMLPWLVRWETSAKRALMLPSERRAGYYMKFNANGLLRGDTASRFEAYGSARQWGWLSANEVRELEDMNPIEGGDIYMMPLNMVPVGGEDDTEKGGSASTTPEETPENIESDKGLNGAQTKAPIEILSGIVDGTVAPPVAVELLVSLGISQDKAQKMVDDTLEADLKTPEEDSLRRHYAGVQLRAKQAARYRHRLQVQYRGLFEDRLARVMRRERNDVLAQARKDLRSKRGLSDFQNWLDQFYRDHEDFAFEQLLPLFASYGEAVQDAVNDELGESDDPDYEKFLRSYTGSFSRRYSRKQLLDLQAVIERVMAEQPIDELLPALEEEFDAWLDARPADYAQNEVVRSNNAIAKHLYVLGGVLALRWVRVGESCPYCEDLDGVVVEIHAAFLEPGDFEPDGADKPLTVTRNIGHPPAHRGCDCITVASL